MTAREMAALLGKTAHLRTSEGFTIPVVITDIRAHFGTVNAYVEVTHGYGAKWVAYERLVGIAR